MTTWALLDTDNAVTGFWQADVMPATPGPWVLCAVPPPALGAHWNGTIFTPGKPQKITGSEFINRFSLQEQVALATAAQGNANMLLMMIRLAAAGEVDLTDPEVVTGVYGLVGGVLTAPRAAQILDH